MAAKKEVVPVKKKSISEEKKSALEEKEKSEQTGARFTKQQIIASAKYKNRKDLISTLLDDGRTYNIAEVDQMVDRFMKGEVR